MKQEVMAMKSQKKARASGRTPQQRRQRKQISAAEIYRRQNNIIHRAITGAGLNYDRDRDIILGHIKEVTKKDCGLSVLTLGERNRLIRHLAGAWSMDLWPPALPKTLYKWKKGDDDASFQEKTINPAIKYASWKRFILAMWASLGYDPDSLDSRCRKQFGIDRFEWVNDPEQLNILTQDMMARCRRAGITPEPSAKHASGKG